MAKTKAELQSDAEQYRARVAQMRNAHDQGLYVEAVEAAMAACEYVDGMMQFERRFEGRDERTSVEAIDYVIQYAPLVFDKPSLLKLEVLLKSQKRIDKNTTADLREALFNAVALMWHAHLLWNALERDGEVPQDRLRSNFGGDQNRWRSIADRWEKMGLIRRVPDRGSYRLSLTTRLSAECRGKCPSCGVIGKAAVGRFLEEITCPKCRASGYFVILAHQGE